MSLVLRLLILALLLSTVSFSQAPHRLTQKAIWEPATSVLQQIREQCGTAPAEPFAECFFGLMQKNGASPEALAFSRQIGNTGYLGNLLDLGPVAIAFVQFPFRANEHQIVFIVNGSPAVIDVDQQTLLAQDELRKNLTYSMIAERAPQVSVWPGDRRVTATIITKKLPSGGVRVTVPYTLRNGCRACDVLGSVTFSFDFERSGRFLGTKLLGVSAQQTPFRQ